MLQAHFGPSGGVRGVNCVAVSSPCPTNVAGDLASREACEASHGDEGCVEFTARTFFEGFEEVQGEVHWTDGARTVEISLEFSGAVAVGDEIFQSQSGAVSVRNASVAKDTERDVADKGVLTRAVCEPFINQQFVRETLAWDRGRSDGGPIEIVLRLFENHLIDGTIINVQNMCIVCP